MSSGSHAPRKPNVAAAPPTTSLFKASSRFVHSGGRSGPAAGAVGSGRGVKRQRAAAVAVASLDNTESNNNIVEVSRCFAVGAEHTDSPGGVKSKKRFVGVRQRPSGRWVAEIKDTTQKIRLWLGTFDSAEEGAKAYDNAARALRGANTRTNFLPVMASCEGILPPSKAARQIQLRQIAAASKACEKEAARNNVADDQPSGKEESFPVNTLPLVRQNLQQSISSLDSPAAEDDRAISFMPSPKPARLMGRRHSAPLASAKPEHVDDVAFQNYNTVIDAGPKSKLEVVTPSPLKLEPQQSVTSENLSNAISHSLTAGSEQESLSSPGGAFRLPSPRSPFECIEPTTTTSGASGAVHSVTNTFVEAMESHLSSFNQDRFTTHRLESLAFPMENFVAPPAIPFHDDMAARQSLYPHHVRSSCGTNRDMYASEKDQDVICCRHQGFGSTNQPISSNDINDNDDDDDDDAMHVDDGDHNCVDMEMKREVKEESSMEFPRSEGRFLREREFVDPEPGVQELVLPDSPWPDYGLMDELEMDSSALLGLDLSNESSGVYKSPFDFSAEAIDRDSCTSGVLLEEHASKYFRVPYEQPHSPPVSEDLQECVLLTEPPALYYSLSSPAPGSPPLSPWETTSSSLHWSLDDTTTTTTSTWDGHSSGSTTDVKPQPNGDASGECISSQEHEALWSSMDLPPLCMVA